MSKLKPESKQSLASPVKVMTFSREEGYFVFTEIEIDPEVLAKNGKVIHKSLPDIFAIFSGQVTAKIMDIFGL